MHFLGVAHKDGSSSYIIPTGRMPTTMARKLFKYLITKYASTINKLYESDYPRLACVRLMDKYMMFFMVIKKDGQGVCLAISTDSGSMDVLKLFETAITLVSASAKDLSKLHIILLRRLQCDSLALSSSLLTLDNDPTASGTSLGLSSGPSQSIHRTIEEALKLNNAATGSVGGISSLKGLRTQQQQQQQSKSSLLRTSSSSSNQKQQQQPEVMQEESSAILPMFDYREVPVSRVSTYDRFRDTNNNRPQPLDLQSSTAAADQTTATSNSLFSPNPTLEGATASSTTTTTTSRGLSTTTLPGGAASTVTSMSPPLLSPSSLKTMSPTSLRIMTSSAAWDKMEHQQASLMMKGTASSTTSIGGITANSISGGMMKSSIAEGEGLGLTDSVAEAGSTETSINEEGDGSGEKGDGDHNEHQQQKDLSSLPPRPARSPISAFLSSSSSTTSSKSTLNLIATVTEDLGIVFSQARGGLKLLLEGSVHLSATGLQAEANFLLHVLDPASQIGHNIANSTYLTALPKGGSSESTATCTVTAEGGGGGDGGGDGGEPLETMRMMSIGGGPAAGAAGAAAYTYACRLPYTERGGQHIAYVPAFRYRTISTLRPIPARIQSKSQISNNRQLLRVLVQVVINPALPRPLASSTLMVQIPQFNGLVLAPGQIISANPPSAVFSGNRIEWSLGDLPPGQTKVVECSLSITSPPDPMPDVSVLNKPLHSIFKAQTLGLSLSKIDLRFAVPRESEYGLESQKVQKRYRVTIRTE